MFINIDRHILSEISTNNKFIALKMDDIERDQRHIRDTFQKNMALITHLVGEIKDIDTKKGLEAKKEDEG